MIPIPVIVVNLMRELIMSKHDNETHKSYRENWKSWFDKEASFTFEDDKWWADFGHNGEPLVQCIQSIIDAHTAPLKDQLNEKES